MSPAKRTAPWAAFALPLVFALAWAAHSHAHKDRIDLLVFHATIYTVDPTSSIAEAMAIRDGKIVATGTKAELLARYSATKLLDAQGKFIYPGFIDAHAHFVDYGESLQQVDLFGASSFEEVTERTRAFAVAHRDGWVLGRGWDQNAWPGKEFPSNEKLNELFPDRPVFLKRVDEHAAIVNQKALDLAGIRAGDTLAGGQIGTKNGRLTGLLVDNAVGLVLAKIPPTTDEQFKRALTAAQKNCFAVGLTTVTDCGQSPASVDRLRTMQAKGDLKMRLYVMLKDEPASFAYLKKNGIIKTDRLHVRSIKVFADGALGSRGASLLEPYADKPGWQGFLLSKREHFEEVASLIEQNNWQMCTHAIGDGANRTVLGIYAEHLKPKNDLRWRIEHAQVVDPSDIHRFGELSVIPSVQPTHATSDMPWAGDRLGPRRVKSAYAYQRLLKENGWVPLGTDFPVEDISPMKTFYAATARKDMKGSPKDGFQMEDALTREQALRGMTIWAAKAGFEENEKGSLERGKLADFVILDRDLMKTPEGDLPQATVLKTFLAGELVYEKN